MFGKLFGGGAKRRGPSVAEVRNVTIGRTVVLDTMAWRRLGGDAAFRLDRDTLEITAQGLVSLDGGGFVHRFYTDDHIMLQAVSDDPEGREANDFTLFVPFRSRYPSGAAAKREWTEKLRQSLWLEDDLPVFNRFWFADDDSEQEPVTFWEEVFDDREAAEPWSRIFQTCMLYSRELGDEGRELLLAIAMESDAEGSGGETTHEIMIGVPLGVAEFKA